MKPSCLSLLLGIGICTASPQTHTGLTLHLEGVQQRYCVGDEDFGQIQITGQFHYKNISKDAILFLREFQEVQYIRLWPTVRIPSAKAEYTISNYTVTGNLSAEPQLNENQFIQLRPADDYFEKISFSFPFTKAERRSGGDFVSDGTYWLTVNVSVWPSSPEYAAKLQQLFHSPPIWTEALWSERIRLEIHPDSKIQSCSTQ